MKKQLSKKQLQKQKTKQAILFELILLYPAFSYLFVQYKSAKDEDGLSQEDKEFLRLAKQLTSKLAFVIKSFKNYQKEALVIINKILDEMQMEETNLVLVSVNLLNLHHYIKNKKIHIGFFDHIIDIEDYMLGRIDDYEYIDKVNNMATLFYENAREKVYKL